jgi:hypothetical protein
MNQQVDKTEALAQALYRALIAKTDEQSDRFAVELAAPIWEELSEHEIEQAKRLAEERFSAYKRAAE